MALHRAVKANIWSFLGHAGAHGFKRNGRKTKKRGELEEKEKRREET